TSVGEGLAGGGERGMIGWNRLSHNPLAVFVHIMRREAPGPTLTVVGYGVVTMTPVSSNAAP
ncbi:MAG: hypothetical protein C7B47_16430, partial [Sulfobacillus thermosulfidooxidans]